MKKLFNLLALVLLSGLAIAQGPTPALRKIYFFPNTDSTSLNATTGIMRYDYVTGKYRFYNAVAGTWVSFRDASTSAGITNGAVANELMKSDGTNAVASGIFSTTAGSLNLGATATTAGAERNVFALGTATDIALNFHAKGTGDYELGTDGSAAYHFDGALGNHSFSNRQDFKAGDRVLTVRAYKSTPLNAAIIPLKITSQAVSTGPVTGIGVGMEFETMTQSAGANYEVGTILESVSTDITGASEDFDFVIKNMAAGAGAAEKFRFTSDGRVYGKALHNNAGAITGTTNQYIASGTYTPTLGNIANTSARTPYASQFMRVGNVVTVSGVLDMTITAASANTTVSISLPIASNFTSFEQGAGTGHGTTNNQGAVVYADAANDYVAIHFISIGTGAYTFRYHFTYTVL